MRIIVTGGAGSIGAYVAKALTKRGDDVGIVDTFNNFYDPSLKRARVEAFLTKDTPIYEVDITDSDALNRVFTDFQPDRIIHLAAWASVTLSVKHPLLFTKDNVCGTVQVFESAVRHNVDWYYFDNIYESTDALWENYFLSFNYLARKER